MQSNNPVFRRSEEFNRGGSNAYGNQTYAGNGAAYPGYGTDPSNWGTGDPERPTQAPVASAPMTIDSVVQKTAISLAVVVITALATWILTPEITTFSTAEDLSPLIAAMTIGSLGAFALSMVNAFKRNISPALVLAFCAVEGVALGALSKFFNAFYDGNVVMGAVIGTFAAFAGTLTAYKVLNIQVTDKFRRGVMAAVLGMVTAVAGLVLGVFMLILDFDFVEQGIANGLPERESWRAAFGMTVSLVWIYTNLLRILAFFSSD